MKDLQEIKPLAEQIFALARELLRLVDMDEQARHKRLEELKKTPTEKLFIFRACWRRKSKTTLLCKNRQYD